MYKTLKHLSIHWKRYVLGRPKKIIITPHDREAGFYEQAQRKQQKPISPWAFIRVKDEIKTIETSLNSILPAIQKGVIAYNECTDGSAEFILDFCKQHPGFIPVEYPHHVIPANSNQYKSSFSYQNSLAAYYNFALKHIPKREWLVKIDCDQIYNAELLRQSFLLPQDKDDIVIYSRLNLLLNDNKEVFVSNYLRPGDHWLIYNHHLHFENAHKDDEGQLRHFETLNFLRKATIYHPECSSIHFPCLKNRRTYSVSNNLRPINDYLLNFSDSKEIDPTILSAQWIQSVAQQIDSK